MKRSVKTLISILMAFVLLFGTATTSLAAVDSAIPAFGSMLSDLLGAENKSETLSASTLSNKDYVAALSLCTCMYSAVFSGHTWIYVENLSNKPITVGLYQVPVGQGVSIGVFSFSVSDGWGIYYNLEAYRENRDNNSGSHWTKTKYLTKSELTSVSNNIRNYTNYWDFYFNCAFFAFSIWNKATGSSLIPLVIPAISQAQVKNTGGQKGVLKMHTATRDQMFRQKGSGSSAVLVPISDKTFYS